MDSLAMPGSRPIHLNCCFTGRTICRCLCGTSVALQDGSAAAAAEHMQRVRAAWHMLHHPTSPAHANDPIVIWLPKLVKQESGQQQQQQEGATGTNPSQTASEAADMARQAVAAAAAALERAEEVARAAALQAASLAAAAGLGYRPPEELGPLGEELSRQLVDVVQADHSELERQVAAVRAAQEARQRVAAAAVARVAAAAAMPSPSGEQEPMLAPLALLMGNGPPGSALGMAAATPEGGATLAPLLSSVDRLPSGVRGVRRTWSQEHDGGADAALRSSQSLSLKLPATSGGNGSRAGRCIQQDKAPTKPTPTSRAGRAGPGKGPRGGKDTASKQQQARAARVAAGGSAGGAGEGEQPDPSPLGAAYQPRGPSAATPPKNWLLKIEDFKPVLQGRMVQTFWSDGGRWWPAVVLRLSLTDRSCTLYYETGDEESVDFTQLIQAGEVAWLEGPTLEAGVGRSGSAEAGASRKRAAEQQQHFPGAAGLQSPSVRSNPPSEQQLQQAALDSGEHAKWQRMSIGPDASPASAVPPATAQLLSAGETTRLSGGASTKLLLEPSGSLEATGEELGDLPQVHPLSYLSDSGEGLGLPLVQHNVSQLLLRSGTAGANKGSGQMAEELPLLIAAPLQGSDAMLVHTSAVDPLEPLLLPPMHLDQSSPPEQQQQQPEQEQQQQQQQPEQEQQRPPEESSAQQQAEQQTEPVPPVAEEEREEEQQAAGQQVEEQPEQQTEQQVAAAGREREREEKVPEQQAAEPPEQAEAPRQPAEPPKQQEAQQQPQHEQQAADLEQQQEAMEQEQPQHEQVPPLETQQQMLESSEKQAAQQPQQEQEVAEVPVQPGALKRRRQEPWWQEQQLQQQLPEQEVEQQQEAGVSLDEQQPAELPPEAKVEVLQPQAQAKPDTEQQQQAEQESELGMAVPAAAATLHYSAD